MVMLLELRTESPSQTRASPFLVGYPGTMFVRTAPEEGVTTGSTLVAPPSCFGDAWLTTTLGVTS